ncbi:probable methyltransferase At1g29790 [Typha latifolia]|uniref:probable methyltransferase At1g29790 n=1 Tax=Typha latifolia TaxID=4733 RepID=UPI003C2CCBC0
MGGMEDYPRRSSSQSSSMRSKAKILFLVIASNLFSVYLFSGDVRWPEHAPRIHLWDSEALLRDLNVTRAKLGATQVQLAELQRRCSTSSGLLETLLTELGRLRGDKGGAASEELNGWPDELFGELKLAAGPHKLPLGFTSNLGADELYPPLGFACRNFQEEVIQYMTYEVGKECPNDAAFAQQLMLKGCEPLPRRRCHPKSPAGYVEPDPLPGSLWKTPADSSITWEPYTCKNYTCLVHRGKTKGSYDCKDCFDLNGREKSRWLVDNGGLDYGIDSILKIKPGSIRIGLDIGGGSGTFAARMKERDVTIITSTMNFDGPFNNFIASRGLVPVHISVAHRLPFYDNTLDIVHSMHVLSNWIPDIMLEFALYDIYRVLRPGGLFWLDHFFCVGEQLNSTYVPIFDRIGFKKLRWTAGRKLDRGIEKNEWYLSALLEKPMS